MHVCAMCRASFEAPRMVCEAPVVVKRVLEGEEVEREEKCPSTAWFITPDASAEPPRPARRYRAAVTAPDVAPVPADEPTGSSE